MDCKQVEEYPELYEACSKNLYYDLSHIKRFRFRKVETLLQEGPQCGIVALAMCCDNSSKETINKIFEEAKGLGFTLNGEIFSCDYLLKLAQNHLTNNTEVFHSHLNCQQIIDILFQGGALLVPYDNDKNFTPCLNKGHTAHWALICGIIETDESVYVLAKHGKSKRLAIWSLDDLARSNQQLDEFSPDRKLSNVDYTLPDGGISGQSGLKGRSILIYPK